MKKILIPTEDGFYRSVLSICRSLGSQGHQIHILSSSNRFKLFQKVLKSKYCFHYDSCSNPMIKPHSFIEELKAYTVNNNIDIILPVIDSSASLLAYYKKSLAAKVPLPDYKYFKKAIDKYQMVKIAQKVNVPTPKTYEFEGLENFRKLINRKQISYPFVLKPKIRGDHLEHIKIINNKKELVKYSDKFEKIGKLEPLYNYQRPLLQEFLKGTIYDCCTLSKNGKLLVALSQYRLRTLNSFGGAGAVNITSKTPLIIKYSKILLRELNFTGPAQIEWLKTEENKFYLMEVNPRFWGTTQLSIDAGINFPLLTINLLQDKSLNLENLTYKTGIKKRWVFPEEFLSLLRDKTNRLHRLKEYLNIMEFKAPYIKSNINIDDFKPFLYNLFFYPLQFL